MKVLGVLMANRQDMIMGIRKVEGEKRPLSLDTVNHMLKFLTKPDMTKLVEFLEPLNKREGDPTILYFHHRKTGADSLATLAWITYTRKDCGKNDNGLKLYDPGYLNTALVRSSICYIDGDEGVLRYRGYPIEELAVGSSFCGMNGNLPSESQLADWELLFHSIQLFLKEYWTSYMQCPMIMSALSIFHPHVNPTLKKQPLLTNNSTKETIWDNGGKCQESTKVLVGIIVSSLLKCGAFGAFLLDQPILLPLT
ncbi:hypothetical protein ACS0TY_013411 [Phlomoides rotata]